MIANELILWAVNYVFISFLYLPLLTGFPTWPTISRFKNRFFPSDRKSQGRKKINRPKPSRKKKKRPSLKSKLRSLIKNFQCLRTSLTAKSNPNIIEKLSKATQRPKKNTYGSDDDTGDFFQEPKDNA